MPGSIEVITGCMFSGKSEELILRLRQAKIIRRSVQAIKHAADSRYHKTHIGCHTGETFPAQAYKTVKALRDACRGVEVLGIDEAQFFDPDLVSFCEDWANAGVRVIVAGLDLDSNNQPFGPIPQLMAIAESVTKLHAVCAVCGSAASRSYHVGHKTHVVEVGADQYQARCRVCYQQGVRS